MKIFSSCMPFLSSPSNRESISIDELNNKIESDFLRTPPIMKNSCYLIAIEISAIDREITNETKKQLVESLDNGYSELYRKMMNIGENTIYNELRTDSWQSGFINFINANDSLAHTAYIKEFNGEYEFYHGNQSDINIKVTSGCGMAAVRAIQGTAILHFSLNTDAVSAINALIQSKCWRISFCPAELVV